jgi:hypothetical protein
MSRPDPRRPGWAWLIAVSVAAVLIASGVSIVYTNRALQQMCGLVNLLADDNPPPSTARGADLLREAQKLQREYRC